MSRTVAIPKRAPFGGLLVAEWIKLRSLRSTWATLTFGAVVAVGFAISRSQNLVHEWPVTRQTYSPLAAAFNGLTVGVLMITAGCLGALSIVGESATGLIRTTFTAVPDRSRVIAAKVVVQTVVMALAGAAIALAAFWSSQAVLSGIGIGASLGDPVMLRAVAGTALIVPVSALVGMGLGALARHTAFAVVAVCVLLVVLPASYSPTVYLWYDHIMNAFPYVGWTRLVTPRGFPPGAPVPTVGQAWLVYLLWPVAAVLATVLSLRHRDV